MINKKHIGLVLPKAPGYSETFFYSKIRGLINNGQKVTLFVGEKNSEPFGLCEVIKAPPVYRNMLLRISTFIFFFLRISIQAPRVVLSFIHLERADGHSWRRAFENLYLNSHILNKKLDWLHFGFSTMAIRRENVAQAIGAKMATSLRGFDICIYPLKHPNCYSKLWQKVDKVHTISNSLLDMAKDLGLGAEKKWEKITPAITTTHFNNPQKSKSFQNPIQILTIARLHWVKGLEHTIEALALLNQQQIKFNYTIIGGGIEFQRLSFAALQLGISKSVNFIGKTSHEKIKQYLQKADIYLQYSLQEGFCNAVLEAQAMGVLCIVSNAGGLPENVLHEKTGWVVPRREPDSLANQILKVLNTERSQLEFIQENARIRVEKEFSLEKQEEDFLQFYEGN